MAKVEEHLSRAVNNELFVSFIGKKQDYIHWKFVALYYSALHYGDAFIAKKVGYGCIRISNHDERKDLYNAHLDDDTFSSYMRLENFSRMARYRPEKNHILNEALFKELMEEDYPKMKSLCSQCQ